MSGSWDWNRNPVRIAVVVVLLLLTSCGGGGTAQTVAAGVQPEPVGMPGDLAALDGLKGTTIIQYGDIDVTTPLVELFTAVDGEYLDFTPGQFLPAWALYRIEPPNEEPRTLEVTGDGPMWLLVADYGEGCWEYVEFTGGAVQINLQELSDCISPGGYIYATVVCATTGPGTLYTMELGSYMEDDWAFDLVTSEAGISLEWAHRDCDGYNIYRSTLAADQAPYLVGYVADAGGGNTFEESVPEDGLGRWVPECNDNGTAVDTTDDFPAIAPGVEYFYRIVMVTGGVEGESSPEVSGTAPWGTRRSVQRDLPDTTNASAFFYVAGAWDELTASQRSFVANHYSGGMSATQSTADELRAINGDFVLLGSRFGFLAYDQRQTESSDYIYGDNGGDLDGDYPYIDRHEDWFIHDAASTHENNRVTLLNPPTGAWVVETGGQWPEFNADALLERLGEDCYDGWSLDYVNNRWAADPVIAGSLQYMPTDFDYVNGMTGDILTGGGEIFGQHAVEPLLFAEVMDGMCADYESPSSYSEVALDFPGCDGMIVTDFLGGWSVSVQPLKFVQFYGQHIINWQQAGQAVVLRENFPAADFSSLGYCCYLLVRGPRAYFDIAQNKQLLWSSVFTWDTGAPLTSYPTSLDDLKVQNVDEAGNPVEEWYYRRDFANGSVIVVPGNFNAREAASSGKVYEYLNYYWTDVDDSGNFAGTMEWLPLTVDSEPGFELEHGSPYSWIIREVSVE